MEMAANVRSMRIICSPKQEEDAAAARELLHPPQRPVSLLSPPPWPWDALPACAGDLPLHQRCMSCHTRVGELMSMRLSTFQISREEQVSQPYMSPQPQENLGVCVPPARSQSNACTLGMTALLALHLTWMYI